MGCRYRDEVHIPVQSTVKGKVSLLGIDGVVFGIVHRHAEQVCIRQRVGNIHMEGGIPARMPGQLPTIEIDRGGHGCAEEFKKGPSARLQHRTGKGSGVHRGAAPVVVAAVGAVLRVPGMGQGHGLPGLGQS